MKVRSLRVRRIYLPGCLCLRSDREKGFQLRGKITHLSAEDYQKAGYGWYNSPKMERIIYIGDTLYTLSRYMLVAHDLDSLHEINKIILSEKSCPLVVGFLLVFVWSG